MVRERLEAQLEKQTDFETFLAGAPQLNPTRILIKGVVCSVRVEAIEEPTMQEICCLDKLIDELEKEKKRWKDFAEVINPLELTCEKLKILLLSAR